MKSMGLLLVLCFPGVVSAETQWLDSSVTCRSFVSSLLKYVDSLPAKSELSLEQKLELPVIFEASCRGRFRSCDLLLCRELERQSLNSDLYAELKRFAAVAKNEDEQLVEESAPDELQEIPAWAMADMSCDAFLERFRREYADVQDIEELDGERKMEIQLVLDAACEERYSQCKFSHCAEAKQLAAKTVDEEIVQAVSTPTPLPSGTPEVSANFSPVPPSPTPGESPSSSSGIDDRRDELAQDRLAELSSALKNQQRDMILEQMKLEKETGASWNKFGIPEEIASIRRRKARLRREREQRIKERNKGEEERVVRPTGMSAWGPVVPPHLRKSLFSQPLTPEEMEKLKKPPLDPYRSRGYEIPPHILEKLRYQRGSDLPVAGQDYSAGAEDPTE